MPKLFDKICFLFVPYLDSATSKPNPSIPVNEKEEYCSVMKGKLGNHTILFSAEVDGVDPAYYNTPNHNPASMRRYVELKTSRIISNERQHRNFCRLVNKNRQQQSLLQSTQNLKSLNLFNFYFSLSHF